MTDIPKEFICPISLEIMKDPVIMSDGQTYDRDSITKALKISPLSPITKKSLNIKEAIPNYNLKSMIEKFLNNSNNPLKDESSQKIDQNSKAQIKSFNAEVIDDPTDKNNVFVSLSIEPEKVDSRKPLILICMIDVSGSMKVSASQDMKGGEKVSFSRLALVKHALKTIASILNEDDKMALITFNSKAKLVLEPTNVDNMGKNVIFDEIKKMNPHGNTNIWDALRLGLIEAQKYTNYNTSLILFTDGEPNQNPPKGIVPSLKETLSNIRNINFTISTFAFGYNVDSILMEEISKIGNGVYGYCPDCTMVGTIFTNFMANIMTTIESTVSIDINNKLLKKKFEIGGLYSGIARHLAFTMRKNDFKNTQIKLFLGKEEKNTIKNINYTQKNSEIMNQYYRFKLIELIENNLEIKNHNITLNKVKNLFDTINKEQNKTEFMKNLLIDLKNKDENHGQIEKAFSKEYFKKWGLNYLLSFLRFHVME